MSNQATQLNEKPNETRIIYHIDEEQTPYLVKVPVPIDRVTLGDFKNFLCKPNYKFFFKSYDAEFGEVKEEIVDDDANLPTFNGKVISWLVSSEGSNASDSNSQCADSIAPSDLRRPVGRPLPTGLRSLRKPLPPPDDTTTCTETESVISSRRFNLPGHRSHRRDPHFRMDKYSRFDGVNGKHRSHHHYESSLMSSDLETTTFLESDDDDASSRITATTEHSSVSRVMARQQQQRRQRRRKHRAPAMSRTSSFSSITDSSMSLNIINVMLNMNQDDNGPNFLGISIVGESNKGGDGGIYVGSIMKGGAVAKDGRIEPGDMILQVNDTNFENMTNDEAVRFLRDVVQKPGPVKLVVAKCWDTNPKGYFTIPRTEPVRPIDPEAWVAHVAATGDYPPRPPSVTTMTSTGSSITSSLPETERTVEEIILQLTINTPMPIILREMQKPDSGLEIRDRNWLKINIPNAFIGADVVDWLLNHVKGFGERKEARKFAAQMLKRGFIRHTVNKLTFSEQCYYVFGEIVSSMAGLRIRDDEKESEISDGCGHLPPPSSASQGCWSNPYSSSTLTNGSVPIYAPMPYMTGGYESNAYSYPQEQSLHSGSGGSSNDTGGSRRERQHLVRDNHSHGPQGYAAPLEIRAIDSDSESNRSRKSGSSVLMQIPKHPNQPPSYANHMILASQAHHHHTIGDVTNHNNQNYSPSHNNSGNPNEFFVDVM